MAVGAYPIAVNPVTGALTYDSSVLEDADAVLSTLADAKGDLVAASAADTFARVAVGSDGQFLKAASGQAAGVQWAAIAESDVTNLTTDLAAKTAKSTLTTKGDIYAATAADTPARLGVGSDGQFLKAASGQSTGLQWASIAQSDVSGLTAALATGAQDPDASKFGLSIASMPIATVRESLALSSGTCVFVLVEARVSTSITQLGCWVQTAGVTVSGVNGLAIYDYAGTKLQQSGSMDTEFAATGHKEKSVTSQAIVLGTRYWLAALTHFSGTVPRIMGADTNGSIALVAINGVRSSVYLTSQTDFPASFDPAAATLNSGHYFLTAR